MYPGLEESRNLWKFICSPKKFPPIRQQAYSPTLFLLLLSSLGSFHSGVMYTRLLPYASPAKSCTQRKPMPPERSIESLSSSSVFCSSSLSAAGKYQAEPSGAYQPPPLTPQELARERHGRGRGSGECAVRGTAKGASAEAAVRRRGEGAEGPRSAITAKGAAVEAAAEDGRRRAGTTAPEAVRSAAAEGAEGRVAPRERRAGAPWAPIYRQ